jgi:hypothetical protein
VLVADDPHDPGESPAQDTAVADFLRLDDNLPAIAA